MSGLEGHFAIQYRCFAILFQRTKRTTRRQSRPRTSSAFKVPLNDICKFAQVNYRESDSLS